MVVDYPASQAALARRHQDIDGEWVASRFEVYLNGIELANGYDELTDAEEQRARFAEDNAERRRLGLPEVDVDTTVEINPADLRIDTYRASGAGGQHINKTDSAVRITHIPSGVVVECQEERSQHKNKAKAMALLVSRLENAKRAAADAATSEMRRDLVGSGDRSERIRTYNYPQGRMTDHRINLTLYKLDAIMEGDLTELLDSLHREYQADQLALLAQENGG